MRIFVTGVVFLKFCVFEAVSLEQFEVKFQWSSLSFNDTLGEQYNLTHPVPFGIALHKDRLFIGVARRNYGIPVTLGYININDHNQDPKIKPYPNYFINNIRVSMPVFT